MGEMYSMDLEAHYERLWGAPRHRLAVPPRETHRLPADFRVLVYRRRAGVDVYATRGMSQNADDKKLELHLPCPSITPEPCRHFVTLLAAVSHFHRTAEALGVGHTVDFGVPWMEGSLCSFGLLSLPYLDGPELEWMSSTGTRFLWLLPITEREREFKKAHGLEALEAKFEASHFDYLDPRRPSVV